MRDRGQWRVREGGRASEGSSSYATLAGFDLFKIKAAARPTRIRSKCYVGFNLKIRTFSVA